MGDRASGSGARPMSMTCRTPIPEPGSPQQGGEPVDDVIRLLSDLVAIPSVNPMGRSLSGEGVLETRLTDYLESWFRDLGVECRRQAVSPGRENLLAWY